MTWVGFSNAHTTLVITGFIPVIQLHRRCQEGRLHSTDVMKRRLSSRRAVFNGSIA